MRATNDFFDTLEFEITTESFQNDEVRSEPIKKEEQGGDVSRILQANADEIQRLKTEKASLENRLKELEEALNKAVNADRNTEQDGKALLAALLEAYKGLDDAAMTKFEWGLSKQSNAAGHRFQEELDLFIQVHDAKKAGKNASIIYNYGTIVIDSHLDNSNFQNNNKILQA